MTNAMGSRTSSANHLSTSVMIHTKCGRATRTGQLQRGAANAGFEDDLYQPTDELTVLSAVGRLALVAPPRWRLIAVRTAKEPPERRPRSEKVNLRIMAVITEGL
jgi:hypothetical protein